MGQSDISLPEGLALFSSTCLSEIDIFHNFKIINPL